MSNCTSSNFPEFLQSETFFQYTLHIFSSLVIPIHVFGAYCILFKTPSQMSDMKWAMLNVHFWSVGMDWTVGFLLVPFLQLPALAGDGLGLLSFLKVDLRDQTYFGMSFLAGVIVSVLCLFETRFFYLYAENSRWKYLRRPWLAANYLLAFSYMIPSYLMIPEQSSAKLAVHSYIPCLPDFLFEDRFLVVAVRRLYVAINVGVVVIPIPAEAFSFVLLIYWNMRKMKKLARLSEKTLKLQRKFLQSLILQCTLPVLTGLAPIFYYEFAIVARYYNQGFNNVAMIIISMHGAVSSVATILLHKPYREVLLKFLRVQRNKVKEITAKVSATVN